MTPEPAETVVRPLVWEPCEAWKRCSKERAKAFGGEYQIVMLDPDDDPPLPSLYFEIGLGTFMFRFEQGPDPLGLPGETCPRTFPSVEAAKSAAQADYERRILEAIDLSALDTARAEIERLKKALKPFADTFRQHNDPGVSDLYNEQPVAWHVPLGAYRVAATLSPAVKEPK